MNLGNLRSRLDRLEKREPPKSKPTLWDALAGIADFAEVELSPDLAEAVMRAAHADRSELEGRIDERFQALLESPDIVPDFTITEGGYYQ